MPQPLRLATRSPNKLIKLCIGAAFVTPNRLPTGMPYRHPSTPKHNQGPKLERHWIRQSLSERGHARCVDQLLPPRSVNDSDRKLPVGAVVLESPSNRMEIDVAKKVKSP